MPTGYTAKLYEGKDQDLRDFILTCARAFSATFEQRDESIDSPPRLNEVSDHHQQGLAKAKRDLESAQGWSDDDADALSDAAYLKALSEWEKGQKKAAALSDRYATMRKRIARWTPPTPEHEGLKTFMLSQLDESLKFDCYFGDAPMRTTAEEFRAAAVKSASWSLNYHAEELAKETERVAKSNAWITALYESLPEVSA